MSNLALAVHGGAWPIPSDLEDPCRKAVQRALHRGWRVLERGGSALDACEEAIVELEDDDVLDAGFGSHLNRDGIVQMDAVLMEGASLKSGAVAAVEQIRNPIRLARLVLERSDHDFLAGPGAELFAKEQGLELCRPDDVIAERELRRWQETQKTPVAMDTVGAVALDAHGRIAAGTSTGGTFRKFPGRVGDAPLVGCGCYADQEAAAVSCTGHGESILRVVMAKDAADRVRLGRTPQEAADDAIAVLTRRTGGQGGLIILDPRGRVGAAFSTSHMAHGHRTSTTAEFVRV